MNRLNCISDEEIFRLLDETSDLEDEPIDDDDFIIPESHILNKPKIREGKPKMTAEEDIAFAAQNDFNETEVLIESEQSEEVSLQTLLNEIIEEGAIDNNNPVEAVKDYTEKADIQWRRRPFEPNVTSFFEVQENSNCNIETPIEYFHRYLPKTIFQQFADCTNLYTLQNDIRNFKQTDSAEMEIFIGLNIAMGIFKLPRIKQYWENGLKLTLFTENMSRDRFSQLRNNLHIVNNLEKPEMCKDRLFKVRPVLKCIRSRCLELPVEEVVSIDEQMVLFRGKLNIIQYVKGKPHPWGVKVFLICGKSGQAYDFIVYQRRSTELSEENLKNFGLGPSIVLHLAARLRQQGHNLFFDNYFSSYQLFEILKEKHINATGTIRINRFKNPSFLADKELKKQGRGAVDEVISRDGKIVLVKWFDNKPVFIASNCIGLGNIDTVERWEKSSKRYITVKRPEIIKSYNDGMGGVDLFDQMMSYYRTSIRSRKWTVTVIFHFIDFAVTQSYFEYKKDCIKLNLSKKEKLDLLTFRIRVAEALVYSGKTIAKKRGRPCSAIENVPSTSIKRSNAEIRPSKELRIDHTDHMPEHDGKKESSRCKMPNCTGKSHIVCDKCKVHLCLNKNNNCFRTYHRS